MNKPNITSCSDFNFSNNMSLKSRLAKRHNLGQKRFNSNKAPTKLGQLIHTYRKAQGLKILHVAAELNLTSSSFLSKIETGSRTCPLGIGKKLADLLSIPRDLFISVIIEDYRNELEGKILRLEGRKSESFM